MRLIDTHCHLNLGDGFPDPAATIREAADNGVDRLIVVGIDSDSSRRAIDLAEQFEGIYAVIGWHPTSAAKYTRDELKRIESMLDHPKVVAVGEIGFDFHWDYSTPEQQRVCLDDHLDLAAKRGMPVVFHCRKAYPELLAVLEARPVRPYLFHCFAGDAEDARRARALDAYFGFDGPITYKNAAATRDILKSLPRDRVVIETDSPYLSPEPHRGKPNKPSWVRLVNAAMASVWGIDEEECATITTANAERFFRLN